MGSVLASVSTDWSRAVVDVLDGGGEDVEGEDTPDLLNTSPH